MTNLMYGFCYLTIALLTRGFLYWYSGEDLLFELNCSPLPSGRYLS